MGREVMRKSQVEVSPIIWRWERPQSTKLTVLRNTTTVNN